MQGSNNHCYGVSLIEVLSALLIVSVGVLGMVGLQSKSLQHNHTALLRSQAVIIGNDMMDRIRVNRRVSSEGNEYITDFGQLTTSHCLPAAYPNQCERSQCSSSQLVEYDIRQWKFQMACQLPQSDGSIAIEDSDSGRVYVITLRFNDSRNQNGTREVVLRSSL